ncbi:hypothetical protein GCM10010441_05190 [Kitasatospora paracochleata]
MSAATEARGAAGPAGGVRRCGRGGAEGGGAGGGAVAEAGAVDVEGEFGAAGAAVEVAEQAAQVGQVAGGPGPFEQREGPDVVFLGGAGALLLLGQQPEQPVRTGRVDGAEVGSGPVEQCGEQVFGVAVAAEPSQDVGEFHVDLVGEEFGLAGGQHLACGAQFAFGAGEVAGLGVDVAAHPVAFGQVAGESQVLVELLGLGE